MAVVPMMDAEVIDRWRIRTPLPSSENVFNAAYGNGVYVIVGAGGALITSSDLQNWHIVNRPELLENVVFDGQQFVISGYQGDILTSADGTNWAAHLSGTSRSLSGIAYGNGRYVAAGELGVTATSTDGTNWVTSSTGDNKWYYGVAYGAGRFVAVSFNDPVGYPSVGSIATTTNGVDWTLVPFPPDFPSYSLELWDVGYGGGRFTAAGYYETLTPSIWGVLILTSTDGLNWTWINDSNIPNSTFSSQFWLDVVRHDGTRWVGAGDSGLIMTSMNGLDWSVAPAPTGASTDLYGMAFGHLGTTVVGRRGKVYSSPDLSIWEENSSGAYPRLREIAFNGMQYLATSSGGQIFTSPDAMTWTQQLPTKVGGNLRNAVYGNGYWVVGNDSSILNDKPLTVSQDGFVWDWPATVPDGFEDCRGLAFGNAVFVALPVAGANSLILSTNAQDWVGSSQAWFTAHQGSVFVEFGGGQFLGFASPSPTVEVAVSSDGLAWETHDTGTTNQINSAAYGDDRWVLVGSKGQVITSTNLNNWSAQQIDFNGLPDIGLEGVAYGGGYWVIVGRDQHIWSSTNGVDWEAAFTTQLSGSSYIFWEVVFDGNSFVTCGEQGEVYQSQALSPAVVAPVLSIFRASNPQEVLLRIDGATGQTWDLYRSPLLPALSWDKRATVILTNDTQYYTEPMPEGDREGYYRLQSP